MTRTASLRQRITVVVMTTTFAALLLSASALLIYELQSVRGDWTDDLTTQAELVAQTTAAALTFDDARAAHENLALLRLRPQIQAAAVYGPTGRLVASYASPQGAEVAVPEAPGELGARFDGDRLQLFRAIENNGERVGTVYLVAQYDVSGRLTDYLAILVGVTAASLGLAAVIFGSLERALTQPILALAQAARDVSGRRDYRMQVPKTTDDEVGVLVDAFNDMLRDLSAEMEQRQKAEDALRVADRRKDEFLATLAHELRNPLAPIVTSLALLKNESAPPAARERARELMGRQLRQMVRLIDDLLDVSRITTNKLELQRELIDIVAIVRDAVEVTEPLMRERRHTLVTGGLDQGALWIDGDPTRLTQVVVNLLNNAAKYTDAGGRVEVRVSCEQGRAEVRIADNGLGIDPSQQADIFDMFMQVDRTLERERAGLGVGLSLAKRLVELHDGRIAIRSAGIGEGSDFIVSLPLAPARPPAQALPSPDVASPAAPESGSAAGRRLSILVADDNVDLATSLRDMLEALGHEVRIVHDGESAFAAAAQERPDVALFDIGMPLVSGYELARRIRADARTRDLTMVAITGWGQDADRRRAREAGFDRHLVKPVEPDELFALLDACKPRAAREGASA